MNARPLEGSGWMQQYYSNAADVARATAFIALTNARTMDINFHLQKGAEISGRVTDLNHNPLGNIGVEASRVVNNGWGGGFASSDTDSNGWYSMTVPPGSNYFVACALWSGETRWMGQFFSNADDTAQATWVTPFTNAPATGVDFALRPAMVIEGWVTDASNHPVNVPVEIGVRDGGGGWSQRGGAWSDFDGYYRCKGDAGSNCIVRVSDSRYHEVYFRDKLSAAAADGVSAGQGQVVSGVNFKLYDPIADSDTDSFPDFIEGYVTGTDPFRDSDRLQCTGVLLSGNVARITWASASNRCYHVQRSTNLPAGAWTNMTQAPVTAAGATCLHCDSNAPPRSFYRVLMTY